MNKIMKRFLVICLASVLVMLSSTRAKATEPAQMTVSILNENTGESQSMSVPVYSSETRSLDGEIHTEGEVYVKIPADNHSGIKLMDANAYRAAITTDSSSSQNTYWKATVSITYSADDTYCTFSKAGASWTQLRGTTTLSNREVYWGYTLGLNSGGNFEYPTSNSVSYNTGLAAMKYGNGSIIGCNSTAQITTQSGLVITLQANVSKDL